ncbi:hypothetical protein EDC04DRAFT_2614329 [Pisolithus marmoratus]|nr:hypothetical protein EDC04DRAFT_2614329 [Pisolithus marmoratus]
MALDAHPCKDWMIHLALDLLLLPNVVGHHPLNSHSLPEDYANRNQPNPLSYMPHGPHNGNSEKILEELQEKFADTEKSTGSKMSVNNHVILKLSGRAPGAVLGGPGFNSLKAMQIWHLNWLSKVDDDLNMKFLKEVADYKSMASDKGATSHIKRNWVTREQQLSSIWILDLIFLPVMMKNPLPPKSTLFKRMVDHRWQSANPQIVLLNGVHWLNGFYSQMNEADIFEADANYLKELDQWLKSLDVTPELLGEEDDM